MTEKNKTKHNKIKNVGIIFELLARQLTSDIISGVSKSKAQELIEKYFKNDAMLGKEHRLYQLLVKHKMGDERRANNIIDEVILAHQKLNRSDLRNAKYNLIKEIKENYPIEKFFKNKIDHYKLYASIYKILQAKSLNEDINPGDIVNARWTIVEHIIEKPMQKEEKKLSEYEMLMEEFEKQNKDLRLLTYKMLVDKFNQKYENLSENQRELIKQYINNISSTNTLVEYIVTQVPLVTKELKILVEDVDDQVTKIKITEVLNQLSKMSTITQADDNHVETMLHVYELIKELKISNK
jgi:hypothetical protein